MTEKSEEEVAARDIALARKALLASVEGTNDQTSDALHSPRSFLNLFISGNSSTTLFPGSNIRVQRQILLEAVGSFNKVTASRFFAGLHAIVDAVGESETFEADPDAPDTLSFAAMTVKAYVIGLTANRKSSNKLALIEEAFLLARSLHDSIFDLNHSVPAQNSIVAMCETLWHANVANRNFLVLQALPLLVESAAALAEDTFARDVKRLFAIRDALQVIDFDDESSHDLRRLLLSLSSSPMCLKQTEGVKLLAYMLECDSVLRRDLHLAIRAQIPQQRKSLIELYGEIYLLAWKNLSQSDESAQNELEELLGQYIVTMLHAKQAQMHQKLMTLMEAFHKNQKTPAIEDLLYRLYGPVLWRSLTAGNSQVRAQATSLLSRVFPLQDSSHCRTEQAVQQACKALVERLDDDFAHVRVAASESVGMVLTEFWAIVPIEITRSLLNRLVIQHASDATSSEVRVRAVKTICLLLQSSKTIGVLRPILPHMGNLIHDKVEKVRLAVVRMLRLIKDEVPTLKFYHIVPEANLVAQLEQEGLTNMTGSVASALTGLMANTLLPQGVDASGSKQCAKAINFLSNHPQAARVFFRNVAQHLSVKSVVAFICQLFKLLNLAVWNEMNAKVSATQGQKRRRYRQSESGAETGDIEIDSTEGLVISSANTGLMASLSEAINDLWDSITNALILKENADYEQALIKKFSGDPLLVILTHFERKSRLAATKDDDEGHSVKEDCRRVCAAVLRCAGRLRPSVVRGLESHVASTIKRLSDNDDVYGNSRQLTTCFALMCLWGMRDLVGITLAASIEAAFERDYSLHYDEPRSSHSRKRRTAGPSDRKGDDVLSSSDLSPLRALTILGEILSGSEASSIAARESLLASEVASAALESALQRALRHAELLLAGRNIGSTNEADFELILRACELFGRFMLHKEVLRGGAGSLNLGVHAQQLLNWTSNRVVPAFSLSTEDLEFQRCINATSSHITPMSPMPTGPPRRRTNRNETPRKDGQECKTTTYSSGARDNVAYVATARAFATSLLQASCIIFSEWLAVGCTGGGAIAQAAVGWSEIFNEKGGREALPTLFPSFCRLALYLAKNAENFTLLKCILLNYTPDSQVDEALQKTIQYLLVPRGISHVSSTIATILEVAEEIIQRGSMDEPIRSVSVDDLCSAGLRNLRAPLLALLSNKRASVALAEQLVEKLNHQANNTNMSQRIVRFEAALLWLVNNEGTSRGDQEVSAAARKLLNPEIGSFDDPLSLLRGLENRVAST